MGHDWILDVLTDLKTYARLNGLPALAGQLDDVAMVAAVELASSGEREALGVSRGDGAARRVAGTVGNR